MFEGKKVAIVYDWIDKWGGVERILLTLHEMFPSAPFYTSYVDLNGAPWANNLKIAPSFLQRLPTVIKSHRTLSVPFYPYAFESFDFSGFDLVISVTSSFAKAVITKPDTKHICYLLTPTRFLWLAPNLYIKNKIGKAVIAPYLKELCRWDMAAAQRPDFLISISQAVKNRCKKYYKRESELLYPPFDVEYWEKISSSAEASEDKQNSQLKIFTDKKFFLIVSRLEPYKKVDLAIEVFNKHPQLTLLIVGKGAEKDSLRRKSGKNIYFVEDTTDEELGFLYRKAQALLMPQEEDFGYVALEAQFFGCPVIAFKKGGAVETVVDGKTGIFFNQQTESSLDGALERFAQIAYNLRASTKQLGEDQVKKFSKELFIAQFQKLIHFL